MIWERAVFHPLVFWWDKLASRLIGDWIFWSDPGHCCATARGWTQFFFRGRMELDKTSNCQKYPSSAKHPRGTVATEILDGVSMSHHQCRHLSCLRSWMPNYERLKMTLLSIRTSFSKSRWRFYQLRKKLTRKNYGEKKLIGQFIPGPVVKSGWDEPTISQWAKYVSWVCVRFENLWQSAKISASVNHIILGFYVKFSFCFWISLFAKAWTLLVVC